MRKNLAKKIAIGLVVGTVMMSSGVVLAADWEASDDFSSIYVPTSTNTGCVFDADDPLDHSVAGMATMSNDIVGKQVTVSLGDRTFREKIYGGISYDGDVTNNTVTINSGTFVDEIYGGYSYNGDATGNTVNINGGTISRSDVYGGFSYDGEHNITGNTVNITGGTIDTNVYAAKGKGNLSNNVMTISGSPDLTNASLFATNARGDGVSTIENNTFKVGDYSGTKIGSIRDFDTIEFGQVDWDTTTPVIEVRSLYLQGAEGMISTGSTKVIVTDLYVDDITSIATEQMTLIKSDMTYGNLDETNSSVTLHQGVATNYEGTVIRDGHDIKIGLAEGTAGGDDDTGDNTGGGTAGGGDDNTGDDNQGGDNTGGNDQGGNGNDQGGNEGGSDPVDPNPDPNPNPTPTPSGTLNEQVLVIGESRAAAVAFVNQGTELIELGLDTLARDENRTPAEPTVFAAVYGNKSSFSTGSHVKVNGWSTIVGAGKKLDNGVSYGAFFENGIGNYRTFNNINGDIMRGDGEATYNGGGLIIRKDNDNGLYAEASVRLGNLQNELEGAVRGSQGLTDYDIDTFYYGAHVGVGKIIPKGKDSLDIYGKFMYTHHDGETFDIDGDTFNFDSVDSQRLRLGLRYNHAQTDKMKLYYGAAWEYEFSGDADYSAAVFDLNAPSLEGSTVIGEVGLHYNVDARWGMDLNIRGYGGQREGISGALQVNYTF